MATYEAIGLLKLFFIEYNGVSTFIKQNIGHITDIYTRCKIIDITFILLVKVRETTLVSVYKPRTFGCSI